MYNWKYQDIRYGDFLTMESADDLESKADTGYEMSEVAINLFGV